MRIRVLSPLDRLAVGRKSFCSVFHSKALIGVPRSRAPLPRAGSCGNGGMTAPGRRPGATPTSSLERAFRTYPDTRLVASSRVWPDGSPCLSEIILPVHTDLDSRMWLDRRKFGGVAAMACMFLSLRRILSRKLKSICRLVIGADNSCIWRSGSGSTRSGWGGNMCSWGTATMRSTDHSP